MNRKIISKIYQGLQKQHGTNTGYIKAKWEKELNTEISEEWRSMWCTSSKRWRIFGWKNLIRFFITPLVKSKFSQSQEQCWRQCGNMNADHSHIFWLCPKIQTFWGHVCTTMAKILGYLIPNNVIVLNFCVLNKNVVKKTGICVKYC